MTVIISGGRNRPLGDDPQAAWPFPNNPHYQYFAPQRHGIHLINGKYWVPWEHIVRSQPWVFSAVTKLCMWCSRVPFGIYAGDEEDSEPVTEGSLVDLRRRPNPRMGWMAFLRDQFLWEYFANGNALAVKYRRSPGMSPEELWPVPWESVNVIENSAKHIIGYQVWLEGQLYNLTPSDVWHSRWPRGIAPLEALARTVAVEDAALTYQAKTLEKGITPRAAFSTEQALATAGDFDRMRQELAKLYAGADQAGNFALLSHGMKYSGTIGISPADMNVLEMRKANREETASAFDVFPIFLGHLEKATFNNVSELRDMLFRDSVGPKVEALAADFQDQVVHPEPLWAGQFIQPRMQKLLLPGPEATARVNLMDQQSSTNTIDERRVRQGDKPLRIAGVTDVPFVPVNMYPAGGQPPSQANSSEPTHAQALVTAAITGGSGHRSQEDDDA